MRPQTGQATVEHVGLILLLALLLAALAAARPVAGLGESVAASLGGAFAGDRVQSAPVAPLAIVDRYLEAPLDRFLAYRDSAGRDPRLDYSTDHCSAPLVGSSGASFDFTEACVRHDFGYRNYDRLGLFRERKDVVDERFLADMRDHCATRPESERGRCHAWARVFYEAVHHLGQITGHG